MMEDDFRKMLGAAGAREISAATFATIVAAAPMITRVLEEVADDVSELNLRDAAKNAAILLLVLSDIQNIDEGKESEPAIAAGTARDILAEVECDATIVFNGDQS